jgi:SAM-dependent methyltransferase
MRSDFARAAESYDSAAALAREVGARMAARLDLVKIAPQRVADIGCATGDGIRELQRRYPQGPCRWRSTMPCPCWPPCARRTPRWQRLIGRGPRLINADVRALPLVPVQLGLVWSNLMLHWLDDPLPALRELHRVLEVGGLLSFATLGPDTLKELRIAADEVGAGDTAAPLPRHARPGRHAGRRRLRRPGDGHGDDHPDLSLAAQPSSPTSDISACATACSAARAGATGAACSAPGRAMRRRPPAGELRDRLRPCLEARAAADSRRARRAQVPSAMKRAKQRLLKPRNPLAIDPLLKKGGAHQRQDKRASRARQKAELRRQSREN